MADAEGLAAHWNAVWSRASTEVSWFQAEPSPSLDLLASAGVARGASVLDVGGGSSVLVDRLLDLGYRVGVLDISENALDHSKARLGPRAEGIEWFRADVLSFASPHRWDVWHDRAVFHFLISPQDRAAYLATLLRTLTLDGFVVMATFGPHGPVQCSGLPTVRYGSEDMARELGGGFELIDGRVDLHHTPRGEVQEFVYALLKRIA